ncbi:MAG: T9SS type A sorting domain-containing protein [Bacteroidetes bacterium]|nr:T9SS type A sorting domain-containing protein [Bacteroidota bacterium]MCL2301919.1 T9SS type A sorting domain-containing protein [Lentimicrobiaceae bacterium]
MKKILFLIVTITLCTSLLAQIQVNNAKHQSLPLDVEQPIFYTGTELQTEGTPMLRTSPIFTNSNFYMQIGETSYTSSTNSNARNTIGFNPKSLNGSAVWTMGINANTRGTGINYYNANVNGWGPIPDIATGRIETVATGWGAHGFTNGGEVVVAHNGTTGLVVNTRDNWGQGSWQESILFGPNYLLNGVPSTTTLWPTMITNGNTVHLVCVTDQWPTGTPFPQNYEPNPNLPPHGYLGFPTLPLYYRSTDGGKTWEEPRDFREYGMTNFECFRVSADNYVLAVRGNHVALLYHNQIGFINYMESRDGGDTWEKKTVYDNGMVFAQIEKLAEPRLVPTTASIYIDENHKVHVVFSAQCRAKNAGTLGVNYWGSLPVGMIYWNDDQDAINWQDIRGWSSGTTLIDYNWEEYPGYIPVPSVMGLDKYYLWNGGPQYNPNQFNNLGWAIYPRILAKNERVYVAYQSPLDYPFSFNPTNTFYRGIFITVSDDYGETWDVQNNTSWISYHHDFMWADWSNYIHPTYTPEGEPIYHPNSISIWMLSENAYPAMSYNYKGSLFMLQWMNDFFPFVSSYTMDRVPIFTFVQDLRNIPAYKNIQEVYKGLWNGMDPGIVFPPEACERPTGLTGIYDGEIVAIHWVEPEYMPEPLLGYNVFRDGVKLNESLIIENFYIDENSDIGTYRYQVSAVYENCESNLTYGVTVYIAQLCEKPVELSGIADESDAVITWSVPENIDGVLTGYNIYRDEVKIATTSPVVRKYIDKNLDDGTYVYQVSAKYAHCIESELTAGETVVIIAPQLCEKPVELSGETIKNNIHINWEKPVNIDGTLLGYNLYRNDDKINNTLITTTNYTDENLDIGTYLYQVSAVYRHCESELTNAIMMGVLNTNDFEIDSFQIFPNPANSEVNFKGNGLNRIEIYDVQGRKLTEHANITDNLQINVAKYESGVYFVKMYSETNQIVTKRLIIIK